MDNTTNEAEVQPLYIDEKHGCKLALVSRSHWRRAIAPRLTAYRFGPRMVRFKLAEVHAVLESMGCAA